MQQHAIVTKATRGKAIGSVIVVIVDTNLKSPILDIYTYIYRHQSELIVSTTNLSNLAKIWPHVTILRIE